MSQLQMEAPKASKGVTPQPTGKSAYRPEVQGLRALAVLMVVSYHIWFGRVSGGVDVFLLISAFLLSMSFIRKVESGRPLELGRYWLHRFKRLLPAVSVVLVGTLAATALFVPQARWTEILSQTWSSLLYFQNWALAAESVDYYAVDHSTASPLQHFWSLSVQGQVFILWPLLFAAAALLARILRVRYRLIVLGVFGALFAASLWFSVIETYGNQAHAYFDTRTRLWEFALGTLLALALPYLKPVRWMRVGMGWLGLAVMLSVGFILDVQGQFPGYVALVPLLAASLIIVAGQTDSRFGADRFLSWKPLMWLGDMSYALYLWHWPVLVIYLIWRGRQEVGPLGGTAIIILSLVLAYLTNRLIERPLLRMDWAQRRPLNGVVVVAACAALVAVPVLSWQTSLRVQSEHLLANADRNNPGAAALEPYFTFQGDTDAPLLPTPENVWREFAPLESRCSGEFAPDAEALEGYNCSEVVNPENPEKVIVAVGNSHVRQWLAALQPVAEERNWALIALIQGGCPFQGFLSEYADGCNDRNEAALDYISELNPDAVVTTATYALDGPPYEVFPEGFAEAARDVLAQGTKLVGIRDNPRFSFDMGQCPEQFGNDALECNPPYETVRNMETDVLQAMGEAVGGLTLLDLDDLLCPAGTCPAVIGNVRVYIDNNHLTRTYAESMSPQVGQRLLDSLGW